MRSQLFNIIFSVEAACSLLGFLCHFNSRVVIERGLLRKIAENDNITLVESHDGNFETFKMTEGDIVHRVTINAGAIATLQPLSITKAAGHPLIERLAD